MRRTAVLLGLIAAAACADATAPDLTPYAGNYTLRTINGGPLPYAVLQAPDVKLEITADTIVLTTNGRFADLTHYRRARSTGIDFPADTLNGAWTVRGQTITFTAQAGDIFSGTITGTTFSLVGNATTSVYAR